MLETALKSALEGEVRFDRISRALYATDASVYQIMPLGVVIPRSREDVLRTLQLCREHEVSITARGGGTSQAGQAIGPGIQLDFSKYLNRLLEFDAAGQCVRVEPGIVLDELNALLQPHGVHLPLDISTSDRATIGGMIANNSAGTRSVFYGKTLDYVLELTVALSDGSVVTLRPLDATELAAKCEQEDLEGACYRVVRRLAAEHAEEIARRYPRILRRVGGYNLDEFVEGRSGEKDRVGVGVGVGVGEGVRSPTPTPTPTPTRSFPERLNARTPEHLFNLSRLFVGSEGTLGLVLEAKLRVAPLPPARVLAVVQFEDLLAALAATPAILRHQPSAVELLDRFVLDSTRGKIEFEPLRDFLVGDPAAVLIVEFFAEDAASLPGRLEAFEADLRARGLGYHVHRATEPAAQARIWKLRRAALGLSMSERGDAKAISFVEDTAVAPERLRDYIERFLRILAAHETHAGFYAHASVGLLHVRPVVNLKTVDGVEKFRQIAEAVADLVLEFGGALSGEHGDGLARAPFQEKMFGPALYRAFCEIKQTFDPTNLFNPGKIVHASPLTANLRGQAISDRESFLATEDTEGTERDEGVSGSQVGRLQVEDRLQPSKLQTCNSKPLSVPSVSSVAKNPETLFDFADFGGMLGAAEQCGGIGECRKRQAGTMCPSYRATRDEADSTRGRANALRLAISGQLGPAGLTDPALHRVLDLCLECKACRTECPTGVDMARLKSEFLHQYQRAHGIPPRARLLAHPERLAAWGSRFAPLSNALLQSAPARWLGERLLGLDHRRLPPAFARPTFLESWEREFLATEDTEGTERASGLQVERLADSKRPSTCNVPTCQPETPSPFSVPSVSSVAKQSSGSVALFVDTFMNYYEPEVGFAAVDLIRATGAEVAVAPRVCCGRALISKGLLDEARRRAEASVRALMPLVQAGMPILFCEPSCYSAVRDDHPHLLRGELQQQAREVAEGCVTFEEWLADFGFRISDFGSDDDRRQLSESPAAIGRGRSDTPDPKSEIRNPKSEISFRAGPPEVLLHAHCHQRALVGSAPAVRMLTAIPGCRVTDLDSGCCGMAGSFGYEREHFEISRLVGEHRLLPAVRAKAPDTAVVAAGFSCRHQIRHFTGVAALHPAVLLRSLLHEST